MYNKNWYEKILIKKIEKLNRSMEQNNIQNVIATMGSPKKMLLRNFFSGIVRGVGISIGFSLFSAIVIYLLRRIIMLNIPVISEYIGDIIDIVEKNK
ncbi:MAG: hypothetical protein J6J36_02410 [Clostridia bacterium]|nr:hypothetical protein [Clostridia bacterium]